jgi:hypothetical protein
MTRSWDSFFIAQVGGSAALTGLVFVALSINLARIVEQSPLVGRAAEALVLLVQPVLVGLAILVPDIAMRTAGGICAVIVVGSFIMINRLILKGRALAKNRPAYEFRARVAMAELALVPAVVGTICLLAGSTSGLYWIALGAGAAIVVGIFDAWVLLVEILR